LDRDDVSDPNLDAYIYGFKHADRFADVDSHSHSDMDTN